MKIYQKIFFLLFINLGALAAMFFAIIYPSIKEMRIISQEIYDTRKELEIKYQKGQSIRKTTRDLKEIEPALSELSFFYIAEGDELRFITTLEQLAQQYSVEQNIQIKFPETKSNNDVVAVPITLQLGGNYVDVLKYLSGLEQLNYYIIRDNLAFRAKDSIKGPDEIPVIGQVTAILNGKIYWQPNKNQ